MNDNYIKIPGRLSNASTDGVVSGANEIYDDDLQMWQSDINQVAISGGGGSVVLPISASDVLDSDLNKRQNVINAQFDTDIADLKQSHGSGNADAAIVHLKQDGTFWIDQTKGLVNDPEYNPDEIIEVEDFKWLMGNCNRLLKPIIVVDDTRDKYTYLAYTFYQINENSLGVYTKFWYITLSVAIDAETGISSLQYTITRSPEYYTKSEVYNKTEIDSMLPQLSLYKCTQAEYDAIVPKDQNVLYIITT